MRLVWTSVTEVLGERPGLQRLAVGPEAPASRGALCHTSLVGRCSPGDRILVNTTAVELRLGTGGWHVVVAREGADLDEPSAGHVMKLRYTPVQTDVLAVEEDASPHHAVMRAATDLDAMPVVCCGLHSQVAPVAAAIKAARPEARVAYVMTDAAALPLALSDLVSECRGAGLIDTTISTGQAFGGELEAVTLHSGLIAARHVASADVAVVANGPGLAGTDSPYGHGAVAQAQAIDAVSVLGGRPVAVLRLSFADARERHRGVSHHTLGVLSRLTLGRAVVAVPALAPAQADAVEAALLEAGVWERHDRADAPGVLPSAEVPYRTMGRGPDDDPAFFAAAAAAGEVAATALGGL